MQEYTEPEDEEALHRTMNVAMRTHNLAFEMSCAPRTLDRVPRARRPSCSSRGKSCVGALSKRRLPQGRPTPIEHVLFAKSFPLWLGGSGHTVYVCDSKAAGPLWKHMLSHGGFFLLWECNAAR